ncbi:hypothetical protein BVRB_6g155710 [Beta vulgaris subsp. vulgaris]|uniref:MULE transposase domain-containing protein n=1 Tax=Beta vulgaris subsp. vulgaris TaxID=3555 RepID=A0A0J8B8S0_BETVV|nr:hypothetical protein BVRB_6g155710 [Beta vulgaris subsp. vulgaris]
MQPNEPLDLVVQQPSEPPFSQNTQPEPPLFGRGEPFIRKRIPKSTASRKGLLKPTSVGGERSSIGALLGGERSSVAIESNLVSAEDEKGWSFFIYHLKNVLQQSDRGNNWCIISDRHKAIDKACRELWPEVGRRYCTKHLSVNWKRVFSGPKMWQLFWLAAGATSEFTFKKAMQQIEKANPAARIWLANLGEQKRWTKHQFDTSIKSDVNKTNFVESFNSTLGIDRCRPVLTLLEGN